MCFGKKKSHHPEKKKRVSVQTAESLMSRMLMLSLNYHHVWLSLYFTQFQAPEKEINKSNCLLQHYSLSLPIFLPSLTTTFKTSASQSNSKRTYGFCEL